MPSTSTLAAPIALCANNGHLFDTLYPRSQYFCTGCKTFHGTCAVNGAVYWGCPQCGFHAEQKYMGRLCSRCDSLVVYVPSEARQ